MSLTFRGTTLRLKHWNQARRDRLPENPILMDPNLEILLLGGGQHLLSGPEDVGPLVHFQPIALFRDGEPYFWSPFAEKAHTRPNGSGNVVWSLVRVLTGT